jgi:hypothetical protein
MSEFLFLGTRRMAAAEVSPARTVRDLLALIAWYRGLRRWGLMRSFAVDQARRGGPGVYLVVRASSFAAAGRLAAGWERLACYDVTVLPLSGGTASGSSW